MPIQYQPLPEFQFPNVNILGALAQGEALRNQQQQAVLAGNRDIRAAEQAASETKIKDFEFKQKVRDYALKRLGTVPDNDQENYLKTIEEFKDIFPSEYEYLKAKPWNAQTRKEVLLTPEQQFGQETKEVISPTGQKQTYAYNKFGVGAPRLMPELTSAPELEFDPEAKLFRNKYTGAIQAPTAANVVQQTIPAIIGQEGPGKSKTSTAQGTGGFTNGTFVDTYRQTFPDQAKGMSKEQILAQRGTGVEGPMLQNFTQQNAQRVAATGAPVTPGNIYLTHFLGAGAGPKVLTADPNTPIEKLVSADAIKANRSILEGKTAGQVVNWANSVMAKRGAEGATPPSMPTPVTPRNAMAPAAMPQNVMAAPQNVMAAPQNITPAMPQQPAPIQQPIAAPQPIVIPQVSEQAEEPISPKDSLAAFQDKATARIAKMRARFGGTVNPYDQPQIEARANVSEMLTKMRGYYQDLDALKGIPSEARKTEENLSAYLVNKYGQGVGSAMFTKIKSARDKIDSASSMLVRLAAQATNTKSGSLNSEFELKNFINQLGRPDMTIEAVDEALTNFNDIFGAGGKIVGTQSVKEEQPIIGGRQPAPTTTTPGISAPAPAIALLMQNPNLAAAFDQKYGAGSAAKVLGR
jgi:hypothetical protein